MMPILVSAVRRVLPTLFVLTVLVFLIARMLPGNVIALLWENQNYSKAQMQAERHRLGFDQPLVKQYTTWLSATARGDLGVSLWSKRPVMSDIKQRFPVTLELTIVASTFALVLGLALGIVSAVKQGRAIDYVARSFAVLGLSIPAFLSATITLLIISIYFRWIPPLKYVPFADNPTRNLTQFLLPSLILGVAISAVIMRMARTAILDIAGEDYVRTARAKGLPSRIVLWRHILKNSAPTIISFWGLAFAELLGGTVIIEDIFGLPGLGHYVLDSVTRRDYIAIQGVSIVIGVSILLVNTGIDIFIVAVLPQSSPSEQAR